jgi:hypothetical protein
MPLLLPQAPLGAASDEVPNHVRIDVAPDGAEKPLLDAISPTACAVGHMTSPATRAFARPRGLS